MRGQDEQQLDVFSYVSPEQPIPHDHPLHPLRVMTDSLKFASLKAALAKLPANDIILDGEIICLDQHSVSRFNQLLNQKAEPVFYAFDLLWLNGEDLHQLPLIAAVRMLRTNVKLETARKHDLPGFGLPTPHY